MLGDVHGADHHKLRLRFDRQEKRVAFDNRRIAAADLVAHMARDADCAALHVDFQKRILACLQLFKCIAQDFGKRVVNRQKKDANLAAAGEPGAPGFRIRHAEIQPLGTTEMHQFGCLRDNRTFNTTPGYRALEGLILADHHQAARRARGRAPRFRHDGKGNLLPGKVPADQRLKFMIHIQVPILISPERSAAPVRLASLKPKGGIATGNP